MKRLTSLYLLVIAFPAWQVLTAQTVNTDIGFVPMQMYHFNEVDSVNMENGNAVIHIPLFGLPQRGSALTLNYSIIANTSLWQPDLQCYSDFPSDEGGQCFYSYNMGNTTLNQFGGYVPCGYNPNASPVVQPNETPYWCDSIDTGPSQPCDNAYGNCFYYMTNVFYVVEPTGEEHHLWYDATNLSHLRATDGSGYYLQVDDPQPFYPYTQVCSNGSCYYTFKNISGSSLTNSKGVTISTVFDPNHPSNSETDTNGNTIQFSGGAAVDTVGRSIPAPPQEATTYSTAGCPTINAQYQPATGSATWTVPGPNGSPTTYTFCFTTITYHTNFWSNSGLNYQTFEVWDDESATFYNYEESAGTESVLQSIVLPNGQFWGFTYDAINPANQTPVDPGISTEPASISYGTLTSIITPEASTISYAYAWNIYCGVSVQGEPVYIPYVGQRTVTDANGNTSTWNYSVGVNGWYGGGQATTMTDPAGNDTVVTYSNNSRTPCGFLPTSTTQYAGSAASNQVMHSEQKSYQIVYAMDSSIDSSYKYANSLEQTVTEINDDSSQHTTSYAYDSGFTAATPGCYLGEYLAGSSPIGPCTVGTGSTYPLSLGMKTASTVGDYGGATLATASTVYKWQTTPSFYSMGLMDSPASTTVTDGSGIQRALTNYGYDTNGNQTSVSRWLNTTGGYLTTTIGYDTHGMPTSVTDPNGNTTYTTYDTPDDLFPYEVQRPTTNGVPHIDYYAHDDNTGNLQVHVDENANTTNYAYADPFGRLTQVLGPTTRYGRPETDISYNDTALTVTTTVKGNPDPNTTSIKTYDSLGRLRQTTAPSGATQETYYDALSRVQSVTNPHFGPALPAVTSPTANYTFYTYDPIGRKTYQYQPDGTSFVRWAYSGFNTTATDEDGNPTTRSVDALGRLTKVIEPGGLTTQYGYDALNNLVSVNQLGLSGTDTARYRSFAYDSVLRLTSATNPESGTASYTYDSNGNVLTKVSPAVNATSGMQTIGFSYDGLNRLCYKVFGGAAPNQYPQQGCPSGAPANVIAQYWYDSSALSGSANTKDQLTDEKSYLGSTLVSERQPYIFDATRHLLGESQCSLGHCFAPAFTYDLAGNLLTSTDGVTPSPTASPSAPLTFTNTYDNAGYLQTVTSNWSNGTTYPATIFSEGSSASASCPNSVNGTPYAPFGGLMNATFGVGSSNYAFTLNRSYDNRLRLACEIDKH